MCGMPYNKANLRDLILSTGLEIWLKLDSNHQFFSPCDLEIWWMTLIQGTASILHSALCIVSKPWVNSNWSYNLHTFNLGQNWRLLSRVSLKFDGWSWKTIGTYTTSSFVHIPHPALCIVSKPLVSSNWSCSPETLNSGQKRRFLCCVTWKFYGWPWKTIWHLFYVASSFVHHFEAIGKYKLELQSGNDRFGSKLRIVLPCEIEMWRMTLKKIGHLSKKSTSSFVHHVIIICEYHWSYGPETAKLGLTLTFNLWPWPFAWASVTGNNSWKFHNDTLTGTLWKRRYRRKDGRTDGRMLGLS